MRDAIHALLSHFRWWRRRRGGIWYRVCLRFDPSCEAWVQAPYEHEHVLLIESWPCRE
jgi:hypothetical protein